MQVLRDMCLHVDIEAAMRDHSSHYAQRVDQLHATMAPRYPGLSTPEVQCRCLEMVRLRRLTPGLSSDCYWMTPEQLARPHLAAPLA